MHNSFLVVLEFGIDRLKVIRSHIEHAFKGEWLCANEVYLAKINIYTRYNELKDFEDLCSNNIFR